MVRALTGSVLGCDEELQESGQSSLDMQSTNSNGNGRNKKKRTRNLALESSAEDIQEPVSKGADPTVIIWYIDALGNEAWRWP